MLKNLIFLILFTTISLKAYSNGQDSLKYKGNYSIIIDSIKVLGNKITDKRIITRELTVGIGDEITPQIAAYNRNRIYSLGIFTHVKVFPEKVNKINYLIIYVEESWYIYPLPFIEVKYQDWNKISYGIDLLIKNFRGRNETILTRFATGYDHRYLIRYSTPYLNWKENIFFSMGASYITSPNRSALAKILYGDDFSEKFIRGFIQIGKRFGLYNRLALNLGFNYVGNPKYIPGLSASDQRIDRSISLGISYSYDSRDLVQFPRNGLFLSFNYEAKGFGINNINYDVLKFDYRQYIQLSDKISLKWRLATRQTFGKLVPYYDFSFLGYNERIRGYFNNEQEGNNLYIASLEMDYPLIRGLNVSLNFIPIIPKELLTYRIALYLELFTDTGTTQLNGKALTINDFNTGYGTGLTLLLLPYNTLRIEYAFDKYLHPEWILGFGTSF